MGELHVVFGAGQVGHPLAQRLLAQGRQVRIVKRTRADIPEGAVLELGDARDRDFCIAAAKGAATIYHCMNPPYFAKVWAELVPLYLDNLIAAAASANARLVVLENLYMVGRTGGKPIDEDTPMNPCSRKGEIRARAAERLLEAHRRGEARAVSGRASDFYGPRGDAGSHLGDFYWKPALAGQTGRVLVDPDAIHTYHFIPDVAAGLAVLGTADESDVFGRAWMLPCQAAETLRQLVQRMSEVLGRPLAIARLAPWIVTVSAPFFPLMREMREMMYQWDEPFIVDDRRFRERFGVLPTDRMEAARQTVAWFQRSAAPDSRSPGRGPGRG